MGWLQVDMILKLRSVLSAWELGVPLIDVIVHPAFSARHRTLLLDDLDAVKAAIHDGSNEAADITDAFWFKPRSSEPIEDLPVPVCSVRPPIIPVLHLVYMWYTWYTSRVHNT